MMKPALRAAKAARAAAAHAATFRAASSVAAAAFACCRSVDAADAGRANLHAFDAIEFAHSSLPAAADALVWDIGAIDYWEPSHIVVYRSLWPDNYPNESANYWIEMKTELLATWQNWEVWTEWYDARLRGDAVDGRLEIARATLPSEAWDQGPAIVNTEIKRLIEEHSSLETPDRVADTNPIAETSQHGDARSVEFTDTRKFEDWLASQPREIAVTLAVRAALRVLPIMRDVVRAGHLDTALSEVMLCAFRASAASWAAAKFRIRATDHAARPAARAAMAARTAYAYADAADAALSARAAAGYAARAASTSSYSAREAAADAVRTAADAAYSAYADYAAFWTALSADTTRVGKGVAASEISGSPLWSERQPIPFQDLWLELKATLVDTRQDWDVWTTWYEDRLTGHVRDEQRELAYVLIEDEIWARGPAVVNAEIKRLIEDHRPPARDTTSLPQRFVGFFSYAHSDARVDPSIVEAFSSELERRVDTKLANAEFSIWRDSKNIEAGDFWDSRIEAAITHADIFVLLLTPKWISSEICLREYGLFERVKADENDGSHVIPIYARDIESQLPHLDGDQRATYDRLLRRQHRKISPAEFGLLSDAQKTALIERVADDIVAILSRRRAGEPARPKPVDGVASAISFGWTPQATIAVVPGPENRPLLAFSGSTRDHAHRLEAARVLAADIARSLARGKWNARSDYGEVLDDYVAHLPTTSESGNFLLADAEQRILRTLFAADQDILPVGFAAKLKILLEQHIGLRAYYPAVEDFYDSVRGGHLEAPLPIDAVAAFIKGVESHTPSLFEPDVAQALAGVAQPLPTIAPPEPGARRTDATQPAPPPDPLGEVDPTSAQRVTLASAINALWKALSSGDTTGKNVEGWAKVTATLAPKVAPILEWLRAFL